MEGYWITHFDTPTRHGDGIAMLQGGELLGGDLERIWKGTYEEEDHKVYMRIRLSPFVTREDEDLMAREWPVIVSLEGTCTEDTATLEGHPDQREDVLVHVEMRKCKAMRGQAQERKAA